MPYREITEHLGGDRKLPINQLFLSELIEVPKMSWNFQHADLSRNFIKLSRILILYYLKNDEPEIAYGYYRVVGDLNFLDNIGADVNHQISLFCQLSALKVLFKADEDPELMENLIDTLMSKKLAE